MPRFVNIILIIGLLVIGSIGLLVSALGNPNTFIGPSFPVTLTANYGGMFDNCDAYIEVHFSFSPQDVDFSFSGTDYDYYGVIVYDGNNTPLWAYFYGYASLDFDPWLSVLYIPLSTSAFFSTGINDISTRPITLEVYDLSGSYTSGDDYDAIRTQGTRIHTLVVDPADYIPACASLVDLEPEVTPEVPGETDESAMAIPNLGEIRVDSSSPIRPYGAPGKEAQSFLLPADADGNGFDTYIIVNIIMKDDETWYAIWLGSLDFLWVRADDVERIR